MTLFYQHFIQSCFISANLYNFDKSEKGYSDTFGVPYDYDSIMHYSRTTWTKNGRNTMEAKNDPNRRLGGSTVSKYDIMKLNLMYHCHGMLSVIYLNSYLVNLM